eukprot:m.281182 g.281182  ORF g.281182 m.281182 type:complete len:660 (+) comp16330_c2_seq3:199-2178(+)
MRGASSPLVGRLSVSPSPSAAPGNSMSLPASPPREFQDSEDIKQAAIMALTPISLEKKRKELKSNMDDALESNSDEKLLDLVREWNYLTTARDEMAKKTVEDEFKLKKYKSILELISALKQVQKADKNLYADVGVIPKCEDMLQSLQEFCLNHHINDETVSQLQTKVERIKMARKESAKSPAPAPPPPPPPPPLPGGGGPPLTRFAFSHDVPPCPRKPASAAVSPNRYQSQVIPPRQTKQEVTALGKCDDRHSLLGSIRSGVSLQKTQKPKPKSSKQYESNVGFELSQVLNRRMALRAEDDDDDDEKEEEDGDDSWMDSESDAESDGSTVKEAASKATWKSERGKSDNAKHYEKTPKKKERFQESLLLLDVVACTIGIEVSGGVVLPILKRNLTIPCKRDVTISVVQLDTSNIQGQEETISLRFVQGDRPLAVDNYVADEVFLKIPKTSVNIQIHVEIDLDANGQMQVTLRSPLETKIFLLKFPRLDCEAIRSNVETADEERIKYGLTKEELSIKQDILGCLAQSETARLLWPHALKICPQIQEPRCFQGRPQSNFLLLPSCHLAPSTLTTGKFASEKIKSGINSLLREKGVQSLTIEEQEAAKKMLWASIQVYETDDTEAKNYLRNVDTKYPVLYSRLDIGRNCHQAAEFTLAWMLHS